MKFSLDQLMAVKDVYFHASCPDGSAAAFICAAAFHELGIKPKFWSLQYDSELMKKLEPRPGQLFVDITPPLERWKEWKAHQPIVIDHHVTVKEVTEGLDGVYATNDQHSGAKLAYEEVMMLACGAQYENWKELARLAMIRDTWKKDDPDWKDACALSSAILFEGSVGLVEQGLTHGIAALNLPRLLATGRKITEADARKSKLIAGSAHFERLLLQGQEVKAGFFNCTEKLTSDIAHILIDGGCDIAVGYFYFAEAGINHIAVSLRTNDKLSSVKMAERAKGGGHERAAGFQIDEGDQTSPAKLYSIINNLMLDTHKTQL